MNYQLNWSVECLNHGKPWIIFLTSVYWLTNHAVSSRNINENKNQFESESLIKLTNEETNNSYFSHLIVRTSANWRWLNSRSVIRKIQPAITMLSLLRGTNVDSYIDYWYNVCLKGHLISSQERSSKHKNTFLTMIINFYLYKLQPVT